MHATSWLTLVEVLLQGGSSCLEKVIIAVMNSSLVGGAVAAPLVVEGVEVFKLTEIHRRDASRLGKLTVAHSAVGVRRGREDTVL